MHRLAYRISFFGLSYTLGLGGLDSVETFILFPCLPSFSLIVDDDDGEPDESPSESLSSKGQSVDHCSSYLLME
jgi:hypothetical protein